MFELNHPGLLSFRPCELTNQNATTFSLIMFLSLLNTYTSTNKSVYFNEVSSLSFSGRINHKLLYKMMCHMSPPVGFGKKCPKVLAFKVKVFLILICHKLSVVRSATVISL